MFQTFRALIVLSVAVITPGLTVAAPTDLPIQQSATVASVIDGDTVKLSGGTEVRLTGIQAPKLALGRTNFRDWPLAAEAKAYLERLSLGRSFRLHVDGNPQDRHGRILAHPVSNDGLWLQGEMIRAGLARVYTFADNRSPAAALYALEREARAAGRGIWSHPYYAIRPTSPDDLNKDIATFQIVEGWVAEVARVRARVFLNFGEDYNEDFTVTFDRAVTRLFEEAGIDPLAYEGRAIRVRGWIRDFNGPQIELTHPEQIELVPE